MKRLALLLIFLAPILAFSQGVTVRTKPVSADTNAANYNKGITSDANLQAKLTFYLPVVTVPSLNNAPDNNGALVLSLSDSSVYFRYNHSWKKVGTGSGGSIAITPGFGFTDHTVITGTGTLNVDSLTFSTIVGLRDTVLNHAAIAGKNITFRGDSVSTKDTIRVDNGTLFTSVAPGSVTSGNGLGATGGFSYQSQVYKNNAGVIQYDFVAGAINRIWGNAVDYQARLQSHRTPTDSTDVVRFQDIGSLSSPNTIITGLGMSLVNDTTLVVFPGTWRINNMLYTNTTNTYLPIQKRDTLTGTSTFDAVYATDVSTVAIVNGTPSGTPILPAIPANTLFIGSVLITPTSTTVSPVTGRNIYNWSDSLTNDRHVFFRQNKLVMGDTVSGKSALAMDPRFSQFIVQTRSGAFNGGFDFEPDHATFQVYSANTGRGAGQYADTTAYKLFYEDALGQFDAINFGGFSSKGKGLELQLDDPTAVARYLSSANETAIRADGLAIPDMNVLRAVVDSVGNIYNTNGTLTGNRTVTLGGFTLGFSGDITVNGLALGRGGGSLSSNTAFGNQALASDNGSSGLQNTAIGQFSLTATTSGQKNTGVGAQTLATNTTGSHNTAVGDFALINLTTSNNNTSVGDGSLQQVTTGADNTAIGTQAGNQSSTGSRNVFVGYSAGANETGSDKLYISNSSTATPLIGGDFATANLTIGGTLQLKAYTVSTLPTGVLGMTAYVTDSLVPVIGNTVAAGGSANAMVWYNGANWTVTGK